MEKLKELRLANGLSQTEIAFELGISQKAYSKIENGYVKLTHEKIKKLSEFYKVTPDFLCSLSCCCINDNDIKLKTIEYLKENNKTINAAAAKRHPTKNIGVVKFKTY